jgi:hypothetical protein
MSVLPGALQQLYKTDDKQGKYGDYHSQFNNEQVSAASMRRGMIPP